MRQPPAPIMLQSATGEIEWRCLNFGSLDGEARRLCPNCFLQVRKDRWVETHEMCLDCAENLGLSSPS